MDGVPPAPYRSVFLPAVALAWAVLLVRRAGAARAVPLLLIGSALVAFHPFPLGPIGLLSLTAAVVLLSRQDAQLTVRSG